MKITNLRRPIAAGLLAAGVWFPGLAFAADLDINLVLNASFENVESTGKRWLLGLDVSGSMCVSVSGIPGLTCRSAAGAILSLSGGARYPILDGNVKRVLARHAAIDGWPGKTATAKMLWERSDALTPGERVADYNQAMMDIGATVCTRSKPRCGECPVRADCVAADSGRQHEYPARKPRTKKPLRNTYMLLAHVDGALYLERRPPAGIWGGLWSLPELDEQQDVEDWCLDRLNAEPADTDAWSTVRHSFSHYDLDIVPIVVRIAGDSRKVADGNDSRWIDLHGTPQIGLAAPVKTLIEKLRQTSRPT